MSTSVHPDQQFFPQILVRCIWDELLRRLADPVAIQRGQTVRTVQVLGCLRFLINHDIRHVHFSFGAGRGRFVSEDMGTVNLVPTFASDRWVGYFAANWLASNAVAVEPEQMSSFVAKVRKTPALRELERLVREGGITERLRALVLPALALDPRVVAMASLAKPRSDEATIDSREYSLAWRHLDGFALIQRDWPHLCRPYAGAALSELLTEGGDPVRDLKLALRRVGIGDAGWKLLLTANPKCLAAALPVAANGNALDVYCWAIKACLADDWVLHPRVMARLAKSNALEPEALVMFAPNELDKGYWPVFLRALSRRIRTIRSDKELAAFIDGEFEDVYDWLKWEEPEIDANQARAGWDWLQQQRREWEEREREEALASRMEMQWEVPVPAFEYGGYNVVALRDSYELWEEGQAMRHCVRTYAACCAQRDTIVFSIRDGEGRRLATGSLEAEEGTWRVESVRLFSNRQASEALWDVAHAYATVCQQVAAPAPRADPAPEELEAIPF